MTPFKWRLRAHEIAAAAFFGAVGAVAIFSESARAAGMSLFRHVADSYLVMFIDTMSVAFICF